MNSHKEEPLLGPETIVFSYSRSDAISDGVLIDITPIAKEIGFKIPVAVTSPVYDGYLTPPDSIFQSEGQSIEGRAHDLCMILLISCYKSKQQEIRFRVAFRMGEKDELVELKANIGPGDSGEPVLTVMLPEED